MSVYFVTCREASAVKIGFSVGLFQESFTIQAPDRTVWFSWRSAAA